MIYAWCVSKMREPWKRHVELSDRRTPSESAVLRPDLVGGYSYGMKLFLNALAAILIATLLSGCTADAQSNPAGTSVVKGSPSLGLSPQSSIQSPTPLDGKINGRTVNVKTDDGYTFKVRYSIELAGGDKDIKKEKPGYAALRMKVPASMTIINTTSGRELNFGSGVLYWSQKRYAGRLTVFGLYPADSTVCELRLSSEVNAPKEFCAIDLVAATIGPYDPSKQPLEPGETRDLRPFGLIQPSDAIWDYPSETHRRIDKMSGPLLIAGIPEEDFASVRESLSRPQAFGLVYDGSDYGNVVQLSCPILDVTSNVGLCR